MANLLQWWNLVYVLAFFLALLYTVLNAVGLASGDTDVDLDVDADLEADIDLDLDADLDIDTDLDLAADVEMDAGDLDLGADLEADADVAGDVDVDQAVSVARVAGGPSGLETALSFFGLGRVPLSILMMTFLISFSVSGWAVNTLLSGIVPSPVVFFPLSCTAAVTCGLVSTKFLAGTVGRYLKPMETAAVSQATLVGSIGTATLPITNRFGTAHVKDQYGSLRKVVCRTVKERETIPKGSSVLLVRLVRPRASGNAKRGYFIVTAYEEPTS